ncbi:hypothetical protein GCM10027034_35450 [Ramlibacter solisilvae]|uniref:Uncharacterized protein n=1 Tax=Ramlibacter tataouinensis TaxID=94132 RepID=A0A127JV92_9BURK|nr:hypothetical protein [Ramlibacter tataouinensis]AMO23825.1 hypothetical protein UC35_14255 [Ramlibacter tataouinensis]
MDPDRTASLMTPAKLAQVKPRAPVSPSAWLDKMAMDAGHQHVARLGELAEDLRTQSGRRDYRPLAAELAQLAEALPRLDFGLLQARGFMARLSGKSRTAGAEFAAQYDQIDTAAQALAAQVKSLQARHGEQAGLTDRSLLEFEVEFRAIEKIIDQGSRWLQDMRNQLKARESASGDAAARRLIEEDTARCELLVARLKSLRALGTAAQHAQQQAQSAAARRSSLAQMLQRALSGELKEWRKRLAPLADAARTGSAPALSLEGSMDCHRDLQLGVKQAIADCGQAQAQEKALAEALDSLAAQVKPAA